MAHGWAREKSIRPNNKVMPSACKQAHQHLDLAEAALEGDRSAVDQVMKFLEDPGLTAALRSRGASASEAVEIVGDLSGDCFGGERAKGGLHRLLGRYNGGCPLPAFLRHVAIRRLISLKRKQASRGEVSTTTEDDRDPAESLGGGFVVEDAEGSDDALISLLREALLRALAQLNPEHLVMVRLTEAYGVPQKQVAAMFGWHESKLSRAKSSLFLDLRTHILEEVRASDPWLNLEWSDFLKLCEESTDLFGGSGLSAESY